MYPVSTIDAKMHFITAWNIVNIDDSGKYSAVKLQRKYAIYEFIAMLGPRARVPLTPLHISSKMFNDGRT